MARVKASALQAGLRLMEQFAVREGFHFPSCELMIAQGTRHLNITGESPGGSLFGLKVHGDGDDLDPCTYRDSLTG